MHFTRNKNKMCKCKSSLVKVNIQKGRKSSSHNISKPVIVKGGGHKCRLPETPLKLKDQQLKTILSVYRTVYQNLMVTANENLQNTHTHTDTHIQRIPEAQH